MAAETEPTLSSQLEDWLTGEHDRTVGGIVEFFGKKSRARAACRGP